ncbi:adenosine deaminase family protein [Thozetella sp. PMI_491]|nr:adenosine deaminase family protein [Thozetella sp. PMI_491]
MVSHGLQSWTTLLLSFLALSSKTGARDSKGVPDSNDTVVQDYFATRAAWIADEESLRQDYSFRESLSPAAKKASAIVAAIRQNEIDHYWRHYGEIGQEETERFAGMMFPLARPFILQSELWKIVQRMPKGALLHTHWNSMLPYGTIFNILEKTEGMVISSSQSLSLDIYRKNATLSVSHVNNLTLNASIPSLHSASYVSGTKIPLGQAADEWPGGRVAFFDFLMAKVTLEPDVAVRHELGVDAVWRQFSKFFATGGTFLLYEPVFREFLQVLLEGLADDGISWVELRSDVSLANVVPLGESAPSSDPNFPWMVISDEIEKFKATGKGKDFWGLRVIWADKRAKNQSLIIQGMESLLAAKQSYPALISGYDLVGQEDLGRPLSSLIPELLWLREQTDKLNLTIPFFFHAGETVGTGNSTDMNLFDALVLPDNRRIGHGFSLYKHPKLMKYAAEHNIMIEVCPISNEVLRLATDVLHHPLPALIAHGVPTSISNDDPAIMGHDAPGLSFDFYQALQGYENLGLGGLGALAENSVRYSNFEDQFPEEWALDIQLGASGSSIKAKRMNEWHAQWEVYCEWIVAEYGGQYPV